MDMNELLLLGKRRVDDGNDHHNNNNNSSSSAPEVIIGTKNPFPNMPSTSQKFFFTDPDAEINRSSSSILQAIKESSSSSHFEYGGPNRLGTQVKLVVSRLQKMNYY